MDNGELTRVVFFDIRKAFDSIDHSILLEKVDRVLWSLWSGTDVV